MPLKSTENNTGQRPGTKHASDHGGMMKALLLFNQHPPKENSTLILLLAWEFCALHVLILMQTYFKVTVQQLKPTAVTENTL